MPEQQANGTAQQNAMTWARRARHARLSPAPGIRVQPVIGKSLMTCWITMDPGAVVVEHSHANEQLGVVVQGSVTITVGGETREMLIGDAYVVPPDLAAQRRRRPEGVLLVETFVPVRDDYAQAWRALSPGADRRPRVVVTRAVWHNPSLVRRSPDRFVCFQSVPKG